MTVPTETYFSEAAWTQVQTAFATGIRLLEPGHLVVTFVNVAGVATELVQDVAYAVALGPNNVATVLPVALPAQNGTLLFERRTPALQAVEFASLGSFQPLVHERLHDAAAMRDAEIRGQIAGMVRLPRVATVDPYLPEPTPGRPLVWNDAGDGLEVGPDLDDLQGEPGLAATVAVGSVTTLPPGQAATVTNSGTTSAAVLNFGIPQGSQGASGAGSGDVVGPSSATANAIARFNGASGKLIKNALVSIDDAGNITGINNVTGNAANLVTGTAGTNGHFARWNANGNIVGGISLVDQDNMSSNSDTAVPTQQSVKAYADGLVAGVAKLNVEDQNQTGGARVAVKNLGNLNGQSITVDPGDRPIQKVNNNGAGSILPGTNYGMFVLDIINASGAAVPTTTGFVKTGDAFDATTGSRFRCHICVTADGATMAIHKWA